MSSNSIEVDQYPALALRFFNAYNETDIKTIGSMVSEDVYFEHHNRPIKGQGKEKLLEQIQGLSKAIPGRHFAKPTRWSVSRDCIFVQHTAYGTPSVDFDSFGWKKDQMVENDTCSILVLKDGKIVEWHDYA